MRLAAFTHLRIYASTHIRLIFSEILLTYYMLLLALFKQPDFESDVVGRLLNVSRALRCQPKKSEIARESPGHYAKTGS